MPGAGSVQGASPAPQTLALGSPHFWVFKLFSKTSCSQPDQTPSHLCGQTGDIPSPPRVCQLHDWVLPRTPTKVPSSLCLHYKPQCGSTIRAHRSFKSVVLDLDWRSRGETEK